MKYFPLVWAGLWRKRLRTVFTLLSIVAAFLLFGLLQGVDAAFDKTVDGADLNHLLIKSRSGIAEFLPVADAGQIASVAGVANITHFTFFGGYYRDPKDFVVSYPTDPERMFGVYTSYKLPKDQLDAWIHTRTGAVIGTGLAKKYGWKVGDRVPLRSFMWAKKDGTLDWPFDIVGIYDGAQSDLLLFHYDYFEEARNSSNGKIGQFTALIDDPHHAAEISAAIDRMFANSSDPTKTLTEKDDAQAQLQQIGDIAFFVDAIVGGVFFTLLILTGNTMLQSFRERIPEFAVLKTLGFSDAGVLSLVLAESLLLCVLAALFGLALAIVVFPVVQSTVGVAKLPAIVIAQGVGAALLLALVCGMLPAWRARRLNIVDALAGR